MGKTHTRIDLDKKCVPGLGGGLIRGMRKCTTWPHQGSCSNSNPFTHYLFHSLSSHSLSHFFATHNLPSSTQNKDDWPRRRPPPYHSLRARQPGCSRTPATALLTCSTKTR